MKETLTQKKEDLAKELEIKNIMAIPRIEKIIVNVGFGALLGDQKAIDNCFENLKKITGQKPAETKAKKAIASFKIREDQVVGAKVTLRGKKMVDFFQKLVSIVLPRVRDFRGLPNTAMDGKGNYTLGFSEINVFPEIEYTKSERQTGLEITIKTSAKDNNEGKKLLEFLGMPFKK
ncbi:MAG: 50S ribosomal protein L5 [Candidatus Woykebacteria bacterium]